MRTTVRRFDVHLISSAAMESYMEFRRETTRSLAKKVGCSHGTIHNYLRGNTKVIPADRARSIAQVLNVPVEALFAPNLSTVTRDVPAMRRAS